MIPSIFIDTAIIILALFGFAIASHIRLKKKKKKRLVCPLRADCERVVSSTYSSIWGVSVEKLGIFYYSFTIIIHIFFILSPGFYQKEFVLILIAFSSIAFLFSLYLVSIQAFVIKQWCSYCIFSALSSTLIFLLTFWAFPSGMKGLYVLCPTIFGVVASIIILASSLVLFIVGKHFVSYPFLAKTTRKP